MIETTERPGTFEAPAVWEIEPARARRVAVLCGPVVYLLDHARPDSEDGEVVNVAGATLDTIIEQAVAAKCGALWLLPVGGTEPRGSYDAPWLVSWDAAARACLALPHIMPDYPLRFHELSQKNRIAGLVAQRTRGGMPMGVYAAWLDQWNVASVLDELPAEPMQRARAFAYGVRLAAFALGAQLRFSPSYTGLQLLRSTLARKSFEIPPLSAWAHELVMEHRPTYVQWCRVIAPREQFMHRPQDLLVMHKYDRNASFVASAGEVPVGDPVHTTQFMPGRPGFYHVRSWVLSTAHEELGLTIGERNMPGPFHVGEGAGRYPWGILETYAWEPQIRLAQKAGIPVTVLDGWYWPEKHDLFRSWRERIWSAREQALAEAGGSGAVAKAIVKRVGVAAIGRLLQQRGRAVMRSEDARAQSYAVLTHEVDDWGELTGMVEAEAPLGKVDLAQPHWWSTIIANANERQTSALYQHVASVPVAAYVDACYCLEAWPRGDLEPERLGKWKLERTTALNVAEVEALNTLAADPDRDGAYSWVAQLARFAGVREDA